MILNGDQRGNARDMAVHLMKDENELVEVHEIRGFVANDLLGAFQESHAISHATQCKQHLYSLSLNPPKSADVSVQEFEKAINQVEQRLDLDNQPRVIVFHEKRGHDGKLRRHAHAVWCRIDTNQMKAIQLSFTYQKLREVSRELFVAHNWPMLDGLKDARNRDPRNFTLAEWQQARRAGKNAKKLKAMFQDCWSFSDSKTAFASALLEQGFVLAQGKRGHVAVDYQGEVYPISRWTGKKSKEIRERLGLHDSLPSLDQAQAVAAKIITDRLKELKTQEQQVADAKQDKGRNQTIRFQAQQVLVATKLRTDQTKRQIQEEATRQARIRNGVLGFMDRLTGRRRQTIADNLTEATAMHGRDQFEMGMLENQHSHNLQRLTRNLSMVQVSHTEAIHGLEDDIAWLSAPPEQNSGHDTVRVEEERERQARIRRDNRSRDGPILGR